MKSEKLRNCKCSEVANSATHHFSLVTFHSRSGQVALYLIAALVAICVLMIMNVSIYFSVSAKNRVMNAGDAAALAVARYQGELLNRIGQMNIDHLKAALEDDEGTCEEITRKQLRMSFLGPISGADGDDPNSRYGGISVGNEAAQANGVDRLTDTEELLRSHAHDIRMYYTQYPESYPEPWEGAWKEYALALDLAASEGIWAGPSINFVGAAAGHILFLKQFYEAVAGRCWCWFKFNAPGLLDSYSDFRSWDPLPSADDETRKRRCANSEVYSLHLYWRRGSAVDLLGTNLICRLTGATEDEVADSSLIADASQSWIFYDDNIWRKWWEISKPFPVVGSVNPEYDVLGCAALCYVSSTGANLIGEEDKNEFSWTAGAKPFGTVESENGSVDVVTANKNFVTPAFDRSCLVPIDAVGGNSLFGLDPDLLAHIFGHLPIYMESGPDAVSRNGCWYCQQLKVWESPSFRRSGRIWLKYHSSECVRDTSGGYGEGGGAPHAH